MIQTLSIKNVVLIDSLSLDFNSGLTVLSGETGAGKSILLDSIGLVLGIRAETRLIRIGADKLSVIATFKNPNRVKLNQIFEDLDIENSEEIIINRSLTIDGKSKILVNDTPITQKSLKEIGKYLVEIHGQFDNQGLLNPINHLEILDNFGGLNKDVEATQKTFNIYKDAKKQREKLQENILKSKEEEENLIHWVKELQKINLKENEEEELNQKRSFLMNSQKITENLNYANQSLNDTDFFNYLRAAINGIDKANRITENKYEHILESLNQSLIELNETTSNIDTELNAFNIEGENIDYIEERLFALKALARKHNCTIAELEAKLQEFEEKLNNINNEEGAIKELINIENQTKLEFIKQAQSLSNKRIEAGNKLDSLVNAELPDLKMEKATFKTQITQKEESSSGIDEVAFLVATNPNSPVGPINKIASGGELSRFMLALKVNLAKDSDVNTIIFDEIDAGIGGATAQAVGLRLKKLAQSLQVLVVTHSPQVAAQSNTHLLVSKKTVDNTTTTAIKTLDTLEKHEEIARMLSGETISDEARAQAKVLING
ncbi:MAG: DNA repair protein RecN [Alphaproteobacteria bacterium]